jgi:phosphoserine aminotransferase
MKEVYNFSAGPAVIAREVLERAREGMFSIGGSGLSVMEVSHRSKYFEPILAAAEQGIRGLMGLPDNYKVLFLQGGASLQFAMVPMNFLPPEGRADYVITGLWGAKAIVEARRRGNAVTVYSTEDTGFRSVPERSDLDFHPDAAYVHYTSNETVEGVEFKYDLDAGGIPVVCDASSNILSKPFDIEKYALIYAGAQKNIGPSGVALVIIRDDMLERVPADQYSMLDYRKIAENHSMANTPNTWGIYLISLVCDWLEGLGGVAAVQKLNEKKAAALYDAIDNSDGFYSGHAERAARSLMNVTFRLSSAELDEKFCKEAEDAGLSGLAGHRTVGGIRASIYNAFPQEGVERLVDFMREFSQFNG